MDYRRKKIGLACAGGGIEGCIYEIGALCALDEAIEGLDVHRLDVYVGVSAGAIVAAFLANGISARAMSRAIVSQASEPSLNLHPEILFSPAFGEYAKRLAKLPAALAASVWAYLKNPLDLSPVGALFGLGSVIPVGFFNNQPLEHYLANGFCAEGRTNDFRELAPALRVVAVNIDTAEVVTFGDAATAHVPISRAVQASTAMPGFYVPVEIDGANYVDGVARRTVHAGVALEEGVQLLLCINPLVPVEAAHAHSLVRGGLPTVLLQSFRTLVHSRMRIGFRSYKHLYPDADILLIEPTSEDYQRIFSNLFSFSNRHDVCENAYQSVRQRLRQQADFLEEVLQRHGLRLRHDVLDDERTLYGNRTPVTQHATEVLDRLEGLLDRINPNLEYRNQNIEIRHERSD